MLLIYVRQLPVGIGDLRRTRELSKCLETDTSKSASPSLRFMAHQLGIPSGKVISNEQVELVIRNDDQSQVTDTLELIILHNLSKLSTTFTCIEMSKIPLILELNALPHISELLLKYQVDNVEKLMEKFLIKAIINKKIKGSIDQIAGVVNFEHEKVEAKIDWELKVSDVLNELDNLRAHLEAK